MKNINVTVDTISSIPIVIEYEDDTDFVHSDDGSFCLDPTCPCHEDIDLLAELAIDVANGLLTPEEATHIASGLYLFERKECDA